MTDLVSVIFVLLRRVFVGFYSFFKVYPSVCTKIKVVFHIYCKS